eukprot:CAMPEP_0115871720 /NCGR_PEP_ID=MMETSP0287-20121206/23035_1 /TAXON_ID=412157 /ORGANISM="Chrysochromulina rotalis, Strain UIO044" /LENGTH=75 /DNA_ID=CAMNT_0003326577 /DNA_START=21 /DNA_END=248 /DNA_ORIENTATION=-
MASPAPLAPPLPPLPPPAPAPPPSKDFIEMWSGVVGGVFGIAFVLLGFAAIGYWTWLAKRKRNSDIGFTATVAPE